MCGADVVGVGERVRQGWGGQEGCITRRDQKRKIVSVKWDSGNFGMYKMGAGGVWEVEWLTCKCFTLDILHHKTHELVTAQLEGVMPLRIIPTLLSNALLLSPILVLPITNSPLVTLCPEVEHVTDEPEEEVIGLDIVRPEIVTALLKPPILVCVTSITSPFLVCSPYIWVMNEPDTENEEASTFIIATQRSETALPAPPILASSISCQPPVIPNCPNVTNVIEGAPETSTMIKMKRPLEEQAVRTQFPHTTPCVVMQCSLDSLDADGSSGTPILEEEASSMFSILLQEAVIHVMPFHLTTACVACSTLMLCEEEEDPNMGPRKGDRILLFCPMKNSLQVVTLTSHQKEYRNRGSYFDYRCQDGSRSGCHLEVGGPWTRVTDSQGDVSGQDLVVVEQELENPKREQTGKGQQVQDPRTDLQGLVG